MGPRSQCIYNHGLDLILPKMSGFFNKKISTFIHLYLFAEIAGLYTRDPSYALNMKQVTSPSTFFFLGVEQSSLSTAVFSISVFQH